MNPVLLDGKKLSEKIKEEIRSAIEERKLKILEFQNWPQF